MFRDSKGRSIELVTDSRCIVGEGPIWDERSGCLLMTDIQGKRMRRIHWDSLRIEETVLPQQTGFFLLTESGKILGGAEDGVYIIGSDGTFTRFSKPLTLKGQRFNDGKVGPDGRAYLGTFSRDFTAAFYRMETDSSLTELFDKVGNSNGLDWDTEKGVMYYNDTPTGRTDCFDFSSGELKKRREIFTYGGGNPDGMTIDSNGNLWTAVWGSGTVVCVDPTVGKVIDKVDLPVSQPSCCAFAGGDMDTLVITSAAHGIQLKDEPYAGSVFAVRVGVKGKKPYRLSI